MAELGVRESVYKLRDALPHGAKVIVEDPDEIAFWYSSVTGTIIVRTDMGYYEVPSSNDGAIQPEAKLLSLPFSRQSTPNVINRNNREAWFSAMSSNYEWFVEEFRTEPGPRKERFVDMSTGEYASQEVSKYVARRRAEADISRIFEFRESLLHMTSIGVVWPSCKTASWYQLGKYAIHHYVESGDRNCGMRFSAITCNGRKEYVFANPDMWVIGYGPSAMVTYEREVTGIKVEYHQRSQEGRFSPVSNYVVSRSRTELNIDSQYLAWITMDYLTVHVRDFSNLA